jgi:hypothetical protein
LRQPDALLDLFALAYRFDNLNRLARAVGGIDANEQADMKGKSSGSPYQVKNIG